MDNKVVYHLLRGIGIPFHSFSFTFVNKLFCFVICKLSEIHVNKTVNFV